MTGKRLTLVLILAVCIAAALYVYGADPFGPDDRVKDLLENGQRMWVMCTDPECGYLQGNFRAHWDDMDWPKVCPKCGKKTLLKAPPCPSCHKRTPRNPNDEHTTCIHCGETVVGWPPGAPE